MSYQSLNPTTGKLIIKFDEITDQQLEDQLATAATCFETFAERGIIVAKTGDILQSKSDEFARTMTLEMGRWINEAQGEVEFSASILAYYAKNAERFLAPQELYPAVGEAYVESSPIGVIFGVEPWNFPFYQLALE